MPVQEAPITAFVLDFETGGLDCRKCACTQIAIHALRLDTLETAATYQSYIYPYDRRPEAEGVKKKVLKKKDDIPPSIPMLYEEKALEYSDIPMEKLYEIGKPLDTVAEEILSFMETNAGSTKANSKPFLVGQNIGFDEGFLVQMMAYAGQLPRFKKILRGSEDFWGNWRPLTLDTIVLAQMALSHIPDVSSYKLELVCERLGIDLDDAHDADADTEATVAVAALLAARMRSTGGSVEGVPGSQNKEKTRKHFKI